MIFALGEHEDSSPFAGQPRQVVHDQAVAALVVGKGSEHVLDVRGLLVEPELGGMDMQSARQFGGGGVRRGDLMADRAASRRR